MRTGVRWLCIILGLLLIAGFSLGWAVDKASAAEQAPPGELQNCHTIGYVDTFFGSDEEVVIDLSHPYTTRFPNIRCSHNFMRLYVTKANNKTEVKFLKDFIFKHPDNWYPPIWCQRDRTHAKLVDLAHFWTKLNISMTEKRNYLGWARQYAQIHNCVTVE